MRWADLSAFIDARAPTYRSSTKGVPRDEIAACEAAAGIKLPRLYVDFLSAMGAETGDFDPFGACQVCNFDRLLEGLPPQTYPGDRYFKVAIEDDRSLVIQLDTFLDLSRSDGDDAPLVLFEDLGELYEENVMPHGFTLGEQLTRRVFGFFELERRPEASTLGIYDVRSPEDVERHSRLLLEQFTDMGLAHVFPPLPRVACFRGDTLSALVEFMMETHSFAVTLGATDRRAARTAVEQIREHIPEVMVDDR